MHEGTLHINKFSNSLYAELANAFIDDNNNDSDDDDDDGDDDVDVDVDDDDDDDGTTMMMRVGRC